MFRLLVGESEDEQGGDGKGRRDQLSLQNQDAKPPIGGKTSVFS
jgi:hypothetical protein